MRWISIHGWTTNPAIAPANTFADDIGFWLYSSGSTGRPKGTVHAQGSLYWTAQLYGKPVLGLTENDITFSAAKLFFAYGLGNALSFPLSVGATVVLMAERPTPDACFKRMIEHRPTVFFGAPTGFAGLLASPNLPQRSQFALRLCSSAGEALPKEIGERFSAHFGCHIIDGIGSTEMLHIFLSNRPGDVRYGTTGQPVPGYEVELRDEIGRVITGSDEVGDLYVKGPSSALMYWCNLAKTRETFQGAWTKTGDKYTRDADGYYVYAGRGDDMLKVSGQYVSPFEVESTLMQHEAVLEAAVIGVSDEQGLTRAKAFVVLKNASQANEELADLLKTFVKVRLAPHKYPRHLEFVERAAQDGDRQDPALSPARKGVGAMSERTTAHRHGRHRICMGRQQRCAGAALAGDRLPARGARVGGDVEATSRRGCAKLLGCVASSIRALAMAARRRAPPDERWDPDFMHREALEVLPALLDAARRRAPCFLFGHSDGGSIALIHAASFPARVAGAIVLAPHIMVEESRPRKHPRRRATRI